MLLSPAAPLPAGSIQQSSSPSNQALRKQRQTAATTTTSVTVRGEPGASNAAASGQISLISPDKKDTLDSLLSFLKVSGSPVSGVMELRSLLMSQKEEKILLRSVVEQMRVELKGIK